MGEMLCLCTRAYRSNKGGFAWHFAHADPRWDGRLQHFRRQLPHNPRMTAPSAEPMPPTAPGPAPEPAPTFAPPASPTQPANPAAEAEATAATAATSTDHTPASPASPPDAGALQPGISDIPYGNPLTLHMPVDVRNMSLALLALFAGVALLHWASAVFIPIMLSLLLTTALRPAVDALKRCHVPRWLGAGVLLIAIVSGLAVTA